jgi:hypothetical protein
MDHNQVFVVQYDLERASAFSSYAIVAQDHDNPIQLSVCPFPYFQLVLIV